MRSGCAGAADRAGTSGVRRRKDFTLGDLRRTAETSLARLGVSKDMRAQLLSHGLAGVQVGAPLRPATMTRRRSARRCGKWAAYLERLAKRGRSERAAAWRFPGGARTEAARLLALAGFARLTQSPMRASM